ncbi:hypothetical protein [Geodermatophilus saharensis]|uniref:hypothetical protein n=1 Tax=Geodermatophilus saharensis TaxID=1137994 RepID=UPI0011405FFA|nr:hypothetical protein [Geodermatophilus saharensis]
MKTLKKVERQRWEFIDYLRLRDTRWIAAYGVTLAVAGSLIVSQVTAGEPLTNVPGALIDTLIPGE